jgi:hypothetical protein
MQRVSASLLGSAMAVIALSAHAAVLVPITPVANSSATQAFGINDSNVVAGSYMGNSDGIEHGFFGTIDGHYASFDAGAGGTRANSINNKGFIVGYSNSQDGETDTQPIFERKLNGKIVVIARGGVQIFGVANGISNAKNEIAGGYWNQNAFHIEGFLGKKGQWIADIGLPPNYQFSSATGVNDSGIVAGYGLANRVHGVILVKNETLTEVDFPGTRTDATEFHGINDNGVVSGQWWSFNDIPHGFVFDIATQTFTEIKVKGAKRVQAWGINNAGAVAVTSDVGSFIWCMHKSACPRSGLKVEAPTHVVVGPVTRYVFKDRVWHELVHR